MGKGPAGTVLLFAGPDDDSAFRAYARSIGLVLLNPHAYRMSVEENERSFDDPIQGGLFSFLPVESLHRHPHPNIGLCEALDPLIRYVRPRYSPPHLIVGQLIWYTDVAEFARQTKPYFEKLRRWVRANWRHREEDGYYVGPQAERILQEEGAKVAYLPPDVTIKQIRV
ncbi:MAG: hypothetical protein QUV05_13775 [Phycisphaerae bacterium]|nr:hypothetical protein [Phycisphaerae bacterium]